MTNPFESQKGSERPDQRGALAGIIVQVEERKARVVGRAEQDLDLFLVQQHGVPAGGLHELRGQVQEVLLRQVVADQLEVLGLKHARVLGDFVEIGEERPLADFVAHQRPVLPGHLAAEIVAVRGPCTPRGPPSVYCRWGVICPAEAEQ